MTNNLPRSRISPEHSEEIILLHEDGWSPQAIGDRVGLTRRQVQHHIQWKLMDPIKKDFRRARINELRRERDRATRRSHPSENGAGLVLPMRAPPEVLAERDRRLSRPFSIRQDLLGEPEPGRSALDRKLAEARA